MTIRLRDGQALQLRRAQIAAGDAAGEAEGGAVDQDVEEDAGEDADEQARVHVGARQVAEHVDLADVAGRGLVEAGRIAQAGLRRDG